MERLEKRDQDLYMKEGDNNTKINIGNHEFTELWDGVLYKALSDYPNVQMSGSKGILTLTDAYELLRCEAAPAILQTFEIR